MRNTTLKKLLIKSGREWKCENPDCDIKDKWHNKELILQIHHIDGNHKNNNLDNLQILCPNCHSQTDNYCSKNRKIEKKKYYCISCGKEIDKRNESGLCRECLNIQRKKLSKCPAKEELLKKCYELKAYSRISKIYNVSDKTIKKWCISYGFTLKDLNIKLQEKPGVNNSLAIKNKFGKPIYQFDLNHNFIKEFRSIREAAKETNINCSNIRRVIKGKQRSAGGYLWLLKYK